MAAIQTRERRSLGCPSWSEGGSLAAAVVLMAALFLAHGLQCAAASDHGPVAMSHTLIASVAADDSMHDGIAGHKSEFGMLVTAPAYPVATVSSTDAQGRAGVVCVAVFTAMALWFLSARRAVLSGRGRAASSCLASGTSARLSAAARWRPPPLNLAVLCVLRT